MTSGEEQRTMRFRDRFNIALAFILFVLAEAIAITSLFGKHRLPLDFETYLLPVFVAMPLAATSLHFRMVKKLAQVGTDNQIDWKSIQLWHVSLVATLYVSVIFIFTTLAEKAWVR